MLRTVTSHDQFANLQRHGYKPQEIKNDQGKTVQVLMTKEFGFWGKVGLFIAALSKTIFTFHVNDKTKDEWNALKSGKITLEVSSDLWPTIEKTAQQAGKHLAGKNGNSSAPGAGKASGGKAAQKSASHYNPPKPSSELLSKAIDLRKENLRFFYHASLKPKTIDGQPVDIDRNQEAARLDTKKKIENIFKQPLVEVVTEDGETIKKYVHEHALFKTPLPEQIAPYMKSVCYFRGPQERGENSNLLGKFDVVTVPCKMDYDFAFRWKTPDDFMNSKFFNVLNAAALNVGESKSAEDFKAYSIGNKFNENKYIDDTSKIIHNIFQAQAGLDQVSNGTPSQNIDSVWVPFGMGAFHRNLGQNDPTYKSEEALFNLKRKVAHTILEQLDQFPNVTMHLCLPVADKESILNHNAFVEELKSMPKHIRDRVIIYVNHDATQVAQDLANQKGDNRVAFVNAANRNLLGNRWFEAFARNASDENLTRKCEKIAEMFYLLNRGTDAKRIKEVDELAQTVSTYGGKVFKLS